MAVMPAIKQHREVVGADGVDVSMAEAMQEGPVTLLSAARQTAGEEIRNPRSTASIAGHSIHAMLVPLPMVCFVGALITDAVYWRSMSFMWETFSVWLLTAGLVGAGLAMIAGLIDFVADRRIRQIRLAWVHALGNGLAIALSLVNVFVHSRDGYTAVVPTGIILSAIVVLIMLITGWIGAEMVYRHRVGVAD
jgi:uncharacterized membrane protein